MSIIGKLLGRKKARKADGGRGMDGSDIQEKAVVTRVVPLDMGKGSGEPVGVSRPSRNGRPDSASDVAKDAEAAKDIVAAVAATMDEPASGADAAAAAPVNIWDLDEDVPSAEAIADKPVETKAAASEPAASERTSPARRRRNKTRLLGFDKSDGQVVDLFNNDASASPAPSANVQFPVGWIVVTDGPGLGTCFTLLSGMSQIGRGEDQTVQLDFGDNSISRTNHAAIVYDAENHKFLLGHGGKSNLVRLNDTPLISNETLNDKDKIRIGETTLRFTALCNEEFNWSESEAKGNDDVEIA